MSVFFINCDKKQHVESITTLELKELLATKNIQLVDVRTPEEIKYICIADLEIEAKKQVLF